MRTILLILSLAGCATAQTITTSAGNSTWSFAFDVAVDSAGNQYVSDSSRHVIYKVDRLGNTAIVAGTTSGFSGDGGLATAAQFRNPRGVAVGPDGSLYIADYTNDWIRRIAPNGIITTIAGSERGGFAGDGGPATAARISRPNDLVLDSNGNLYFTDTFNYRIRRVTPAGIISTVAGTGASAHSGDGGPALLAGMSPVWLALGPDGSLYFGDDENKRVRKISNNVVTTVAGNGTAASGGDGGPAASASFASVYGIALDAAGNLYVADYWGARVRKITPGGVITTYAGNGRSGTSGDGGPATAAQLYAPAGLAVDAGGALYIADTGAIRKVAPVEPPAITSVSPAFLGKAGIAANMYLEIFGTNFGGTSRVWGSLDFNGSNAPTSLDGTRVLVNGVPAYIYYVDPKQVNINVPEDTATGPVTVQVVTPTGSSNTVTVIRNRVSPTFQTTPLFLVGGKQHVVAQTGDFRSYIGAPGMIPGVTFTRAVPGQSVILYALGLGPTTPATRAGVSNLVNATVALPIQVLIGGRSARIGFAGMVGNSIGLYQLNVEIPDLSPGEYPIELSVDGVKNEQNLVITIGGV